MPDENAQNAQVRAALAKVVDPTTGRDVVASGLLAAVTIEAGVARVVYRLPPQLATAPVQRSLIEQTVDLTRRVAAMEARVEFQVVAAPGAQALPGVKHVVAIGAGKGGVGKSTVAALLAAGVMRRGQRAGLLDADVYGPSIPKITGTEDAQPQTDEAGRLIPPEKDGLPIMSMGYLVPADQAVIWRGPMAQKYVKEFLDRGHWGELDYLFVDLPPGTGDIPLTLAQSIPLTGAVVVCTPQDVALLDAVKAVRMYQKLGVAPLGLIENMSYYICPHCGQREEIFDHGGCERAARELGVAFLGAIPLNIAIRRNGDSGQLFENYTRGPKEVTQALEAVIDRLLESVQQRDQAAPPPPQLTIR